MIVTRLISRVPRPIRTCGPDDAERADLDVVVDFGPRIDRRGCSNANCHRRILRIAAIIWQWKRLTRVASFLRLMLSTFSPSSRLKPLLTVLYLFQQLLRQLRVKLMAAAVTHHVADDVTTG